MSNLRTFLLGDEGVDYVLAELSDGGTFAREALGRLPIASGEVTTRLPDNVPPEELIRFATGGKLPTPPPEEWRKIPGATLVPVPSTIDDLTKLISEHLSTPERVCFLEDANASRGDPWLAQPGVPTGYYKEEVYHWLIGPQPATVVKQAVKTAQSLFIFVGALTSLADTQMELVAGGDLSLRTLQRMADNTCELFLGAYDGEGYVTWRRGADESVSSLLNRS